MLKPGASKFWLILLSGVMWSGVGILLNSYAYRWLIVLKVSEARWYLLGGLILGSGIYVWGFSRLAENNIQRIDMISSDKPCIFAFQKWTNYPLVIFMISLGIILREFSPISKPWLAVLYSGIGLSLLISSFHYYRKLIINLAVN
ncbi:MAG: hypothetical protein GWN30_31470 [Gammaproteobacteria bacterium]|nr:hypothetical protein [Gammaproteobacteria bacterium]